MWERGYSRSWAPVGVPGAVPVTVDACWVQATTMRGIQASPCDPVHCCYRAMFQSRYNCVHLRLKV